MHGEAALFLQEEATLYIGQRSLSVITLRSSHSLKANFTQPDQPDGWGFGGARERFCTNGGAWEANRRREDRS